MNEKQNRDLRLKVLEHYTQAGNARRLDLHPTFSGYKRYEIRDMVHALHRVGLICRIRGQATGTVYAITGEGRSFLAILKAQAG